MASYRSFDRVGYDCNFPVRSLFVASTRTSYEMATEAFFSVALYERKYTQISLEGLHRFGKREDSVGAHICGMPGTYEYLFWKNYSLLA